MTTRKDRDPRPVLYAKWSKRERALVYGGTNKSDGGMLCSELEGRHEDARLVKELQARGYDITTLRFSIRLNRALHTGNAAEEAEQNSVIEAWRAKRTKNNR